MENLVRDRLTRADAMEDEIIVDDFAGQPGSAEAGPKARRQCRGAARQGVRAAVKPRRDGPVRAGGYSGIWRRHRDVGDDGLTVVEQRLDDGTLIRGSACQQIRTAKLFRRLGRVPCGRNPLSDGPADDRPCQDGTKVATVGASHLTSSQHLLLSPLAVVALAVASSSPQSTLPRKQG
jgi:hypothetical protein